VYAASGPENVTVTVSSLPAVPPKSHDHRRQGRFWCPVREIDVVAPASPYELVDQAPIVRVPSARLEALTPVKLRVPPPAIPAAVAVTVDDPSPTDRWTVSLASEGDGSTTSTLSEAAFAAVTKALPVPPPFVSVTEVGASGATITDLLWELVPPVHRKYVGVSV
jgi:hypothetical protein